MRSTTSSSLAAAGGPPNFNAACALALAGCNDDAFARLEKAAAADYGTRGQ